MRKDAEIVFDFSLELGFKAQDIIITGRSIGTGPASHLASVRTGSGLILVSAYLSIKEIVSSKVGSWGKLLIKEKFRNRDKMPLIKSPILFIHGMLDGLIPYQHSMELKKLSNTITMEHYIPDQTKDILVFKLKLWSYQL